MSLRSMERYSMLHLNSEDFVYGSKDQPTFLFEHEIENFDYLRLIRAYVPFTYYVFSSGYTSCTVQGIHIATPPEN